MNERGVRRRLRCRIKAGLYQLLALVSRRLTRPLLVRAGDDVHVIDCRLAVAGQDARAGPARFPGLHFSPIEAAVWMACASAPKFGKEIARALGRGYNTELKFLLENLVARRVLTHERGVGYAQAALEEGPTQTSADRS